MKNKRKNIFIRSWELVVDTSATWDRIASDHISKKEIRKQFVFPWIVLCVLTGSVFSAVYAAENAIETGFQNAIVTAVSFFGAYFLSNAVCFWYLRKQHHDKYSNVESEKIVSYSFTVVFVLKILTTALPSLFFLQILSIYTAYLVWDGCRSVFKMDEDERGNIVLVYSLMIVLSPAFISLIIHFMLPNV